MTVARTSTAPAFTKALVAAMKSRLPAVDVFHGWPDADSENEVIYTDGLRLNQESAAQSRVTRPRNEDYVLDVVIEVAAPAGTTEEASDRAWELVGELEDELRNADNPGAGVGLGVDGVWHCEVRTVEEEPGFLKDPENPAMTIGRACRLTVGVGVKARITL